MTLHLLRGLFILLMGSIGYAYSILEYGPFGRESFAAFPLAIGLAILLLTIDVFSSRRKLLSLSALLFGTLVGLLLAYSLGQVVRWLVLTYVSQSGPIQEQLVAYLQMLLNIACCYLMVSFIMQTKDDIRFIIPYVEFARKSQGSRSMILDTSVLIDGRVADLAEVGILDGRLIVPRVVLDELQKLSDSTDRLRRNRGRRGMDMVGRLQACRKVEVVIFEGSPRDSEKLPVDEQLVLLANELDGRILTTDFNLDKIAQLRGVTVINLNDLAAAVKPLVLPGEIIKVDLIKPGEQMGQAVGYLADGTMVVVEQARHKISKGEQQIMVTSVMQTSAGRMIFARIENESKTDQAETALNQDESRL